MSCSAMKPETATLSWRHQDATSSVKTGALSSVGVIIHPTSLPGGYGVGEIGSEAFALVDWMASAGLSLWQVRAVPTHCNILCSIASESPSQLWSLCPLLPSCAIMHIYSAFMLKITILESTIASTDGNTVR